MMTMSRPVHCCLQTILCSPCQHLDQSVMSLNSAFEHQSEMPTLL